MVWWREGGGALELTHLGSSSHPSVVVCGGSLCPRGLIVHVGSCHLGVGRRPRVLEGCAGGGARCLSWFQCDGLGMVVGVHMGGGSSLPVGACRSWVCGWGILVVGRGLLFVRGSLSVCACGRCWWWCLSPKVVERRVAAWWW